MPFRSWRSLLPRPLPPSTLLWTGCLLLLAMVWGAVVATGAHNLHQDRRERAKLAASTAKGFSEYVGLHVLIVDRMLMNMRLAYAAGGALPSHEVVRQDLGQMAPMLLQVALADASGQVVASTLPLPQPVSIADRPHFLAFRSDPSDRLHFSPPVVGRVSGRMSLQLVRPMLGPGGEFRGVIVASIDPLRLQQYFGSLEAFADDGAVLIAGRADGIVRARFTQREITWGQSLLRSENWARLSGEAAGNYQAISTIDGVPRIVGFHQAGSYPLVVTVSWRQAPWHALGQGHAIAIGIALGFSLILVRLTALRARRAREQQRLIEQLELGRAREMEANRLKSNFLASISHELRTPLNSILGFSELIRDLGEDATIRRYADLIHGSGKHLLALLNTLLDLAKIEAGRMEVARETVDLDVLLQNLAETHRVAASAKGLDLVLELPARRLQADTDRTKLVQVLNNVLHNAVKFTQQGSIRMRAGLVGGELVVQVEDTGPGIPPPMLARAFDRFAAVEGAAAGGGTGLGLALSRELVGLLGGSMRLASTVGSGTQVEIRLPGVRAVEPAPAAQPEEVQA